METMKAQNITTNDLYWQIKYDASRCTLCGSCVAACSFRAIECKVERRRMVFSEGDFPDPKTRFSAVPVIRQVNSVQNFCRGCGICEKVCPNDAIGPVRNPDTRFPVISRCLMGNSIQRGGRKNLEGDHRALSSIGVGRISQMTDPSLDASRHTFDLLAPFGRILPPKQLPLKVGTNGKLEKSDETPPVRWIYPVIIGDMSIGALSWRMWEAMAIAVAYLNEECGLPVRFCSGEGGVPERLLKSRYLKYLILQIASGHFGWNRIIKTMPHMIEDPAGILIKIGQGAKPGDGGLLLARKVAEHIQAIRGVPKADLLSPPTIRGSTPSRKASRRCFSPSTQLLNSGFPLPSRWRPARPRFRFSTTWSVTPTTLSAVSSWTVLTAVPERLTRFLWTTPAIRLSASCGTVILPPCLKAARGRFLSGPGAGLEKPVILPPMPLR